MKLFRKILSCKEFDITCMTIGIINAIGFFACSRRDEKFKNLK